VGLPQAGNAVQKILRMAFIFPGGMKMMMANMTIMSIIPGMMRTWRTELKG